MRSHAASAMACILVMVSLATTGARSAAAQNRLAIVGGVLIDGQEGVPIENAVVLVEGDRVTHVGTVADTKIPAGAKVINADGYTVMPGMSDTHVHLFIVGHGIYDQYFPKYQNRMREIMPISARELLMAGVTSARDLGAPLDEILWLKREIEADRLPGPRLFVSGPFLQKSLPASRGTSYDSRVQAFFRWTVNGAEDARAKTRRLIDAGVDVIKVIQLAQLTREERLAIADEAHKAGLPIAVHAGDLEEVKAAAEMRVASIEHTSGGSDELNQVMGDAGIVASVTAMVGMVYDITKEWPERLDHQQLKRDLPPDLYRDVRESLNFFSRLNYFSGAKNANEHRPARVKRLYDSGVRLVTGTDCGTPMNFAYECTWQELDLFVRFGIPPMKVISMATRYPALLYGKYADLGTIEPGKWADIIVVNGNPLRNMSALQQSNVVYVIKGGKVYKSPDGAGLAQRN